MKLLITTKIDIVKYCQDQFGFKLPSELIAYCTGNFKVNFALYKQVLIFIKMLRKNLMLDKF